LKLLVPFALGLLIVFGGGFFLVNRLSAQPVQQPIAFPHSKHTAANIECVTCHKTVKTADAATIPQADTCMTCHQAPVTTNPEADKIKTYFESGEPIPWVRLFKLADDINFPHRSHITGGVDCATCHGNMGTSKPGDSIAGLGRQGASGPVSVYGQKVLGLNNRYGYKLMYEVCMDCHEQRGVSTDCLTCHR